ncbi:FecR domain-containing protein [Methylobacillus caricis]|uniref:FecR family protein n=1 Tax=Methylobacillus caricis TaxID=1971611 RepID=UPI001CFFD833|nr:FecR domain-containing protein [Methylobacillus caricis]MCB5186533.1 FecR domain-containing protein [Methylobacillus caricis]
MKAISHNQSIRHGQVLFLISSGLALTLSVMVAFNARAETISHTVVNGDNLYNLANQYLGDANAWRHLQKLNGVRNPYKLEPGSILTIPRIGTTVNASFVYGKVTILDEQGNPIRQIEHGEKLAEGTTISTGDNSYLSLEFADQSIARVLANSTIRLNSIKEGEQPTTPQRVIYLKQGNIDVSVTPAPARKQPHFKVITPMAVAAVRGTRFVINTQEEAMTSSVTQGRVELNHASARTTRGKKKNTDALLAAGQGVTASLTGLGTVQNLLPAPTLDHLPSKLEQEELLNFSWPALESGTSYSYRVARDENMEEVFHNGNSSSPELQLLTLPDGDYFLGIRGLDDQSIPGFESVHHFNIYAHPSSPLLIYPLQQQAITGNSQFSCTPVLNATAYHLQIASDMPFEHIVVDANDLKTCSYQAETLAAGNYFWRVATIVHDEIGNTQHGPFSQASAIIVDEDAQTATASGSKAYWVSQRPDIQYHAQISKDQDFSSLVTEKILETPQLDISSLPDGRYYVKLATQLENGTGPYSDARILEVEHVDNDFDRTWYDKPKQ